jgi:hypothetical protein
MNIYYTAKDIEELAAKGLKELEIGPQVFLTDFAYETAEQLNIALVKPGLSVPQTQPAAPDGPQRAAPSRFNKPRGCQHGASAPLEKDSVNSAQAAASQQVDETTSVNRLVDIMGKILKRGD